MIERISNHWIFDLSETKKIRGIGAFQLGCSFALLLSSATTPPSPATTVASVVLAAGGAAAMWVNEDDTE